MNPHLERAMLLYQQSRYELAETELRQSLAIEPDNAQAHSLLALCLAEREQFKEATEEAEQAVHLEPDSSFSYYALSRIWHERHYEEQALAAINEAIRLDPWDADYLALLAQIQMVERRWPAALEAAERGLQHDPEHVACTNLRAMALVKLGRKAEAGATIDSALRRNPENSLTHANQGWTLLEQGDPKKALEHFRESLRLNPENEWARQGIIEALKARNFIYALMLRYFLAMAKFRRRAQWGIIVGAYVGIQILGGIEQTNPQWSFLIRPIRIVYMAFVLMTWLSSPFFNLLLRFNRFGRLALSREQTIASNWLAFLLLLVLVSLGGCVVHGFNSPWVFGALVSGLLLLPVTSTFKCDEGWPRKVMAAFTIFTALVGLAVVILPFLADANSGDDQRHLAKTEGGALSLFLICSIGSTWLANILIMQRPRR